MTPLPNGMSPGGTLLFKVLAFVFLVGWMVGTWGDIRADDIDVHVGLALILLPLAVFAVWVQIVDPDLGERLKQRRLARQQNTSEEEKNGGRRFLLITQSSAVVLTLLTVYLLRVSGIAAPHFDVRMTVISLYGLFAIPIMLGVALRMKARGLSN